MEFSFIVPPQIIFGCGSISRLPFEIKDLKAEKPLVVTSRGMLERDFAKEIFSSLKSSRIACQVYNQVNPEPSVRDAENCLQFAKENGCDFIIGLGGGSVMDVAKKVGMDLEVPKIMIPTIAGTGSEVTHESVLKVEGEKRAFVDKKLTPDVAIVDPNLMMTMPKRLIASSGIDALAHALECYESRRSNPLVKPLALEAFRLLEENIQKAVEGDREARVNMALGSLMAGVAFGNSGTTLAHALSYPLSNRRMPHGEAIAMVLPYALEFNRSESAFIEKMKEIVKPIKLRWNLDWDIEEMAEEVMDDKRHLANNPREVTFQNVVRIFEKIEQEFQERQTA